MIEVSGFRLKVKTKIGFVCWIGLLGLLAGCSADTECRQTTAIYLNMVLTGDSLRPSTDSVRLALDSLAMDTVAFSTVKGMEIHGLGRDSIICGSESSVGTVQLPLRPDSLHTEFVFHYNGHRDTLSIRHDNDMNFISLACGCYVFHTIEGISMSHHFLDSVHILNDLVTTTGDKHLQLYFHKW